MHCLVHYVFSEKSVFEKEKLSEISRLRTYMTDTHPSTNHQHEEEFKQLNNLVKVDILIILEDWYFGANIYILQVLVGILKTETL